MTRRLRRPGQPMRRTRPLDLVILAGAVITFVAAALGVLWSWFVP